jgi:hypothetical protein
VCVGNCKTRPGYLLPGDVERLVQRLGMKPDEFLVASPGALVQNSMTGRAFRIGTITPKWDRRKKRCVLLGDDNRCKVHDISPFGCAYFDCKMSRPEGDRRSGWALRIIQDSPEYSALRAKLPMTEVKR